MNVVESFYHLTKVTDNNNRGQKYQLVRRSGKSTRLDALLTQNMVATLKPMKPRLRKRPYRYLTFSVGGQAASKGLTLIIRYDDKSGNGSGRTHLFYDNFIVIVDGDNLYMYLHKSAYVTSLSTNTAMADGTEIYVDCEPNSPYQRYLNGDESIMSEMKLLADNATRV